MTGEPIARPHAMTGEMPPSASWHRWPRAVHALFMRLVLFALLWWILAAGDTASWTLGAPLVMVSATMSLVLSKPTPWSAWGALGFAPFFLWRSLRAGVDVAWRACVPSLPIAPAILTYRLRLPPGRARLFMTAVVSLLPGTLSAEVVRHRLCVHVLDRRSDAVSDLARLEEKVAQMFRLRLAEPAPQSGPLAAEA